MEASARGKYSRTSQGPRIRTARSCRPPSRTSAASAVGLPAARRGICASGRSHRHGRPTIRRPRWDRRARRRPEARGGYPARRSRTTNRSRRFRQRRAASGPGARTSPADSRSRSHRTRSGHSRPHVASPFSGAQGGSTSWRFGSRSSEFARFLACAQSGRRMRGPAPIRSRVDPTRASPACVGRSNSRLWMRTSGCPTPTAEICCINCAATATAMAAGHLLSMPSTPIGQTELTESHRRRGPRAS